DLARRVTALAPGAEIPVIVRMDEPVDLGRFSSGRASAPAMIAALRATAARSQEGVLRLLRERGRAARARVLWIDNSVAVTVPPGLLDELAALPGVDHVDFDEPVTMGEAVPDEAALLNPGWNVTKVHAPDVWSGPGYDGTGVLIGSMDTGFDPSHPALA